MPTVGMKPVKDQDGVTKFVRSESALDINLDSWQPPTPYDTMDEYNDKLLEFLAVQKELFNISFPKLQIPMRISEEQIKLLSSGHVVDSLDIEAIVGGYYNTRYGAGIRSPLTYDEAILQMVLGKKWKKKAMFKKMPVNEKDIIPFSQHQLRDQFDQNKILYTWAKGEKTWAKGKRKIQKRHH